MAMRCPKCGKQSDGVRVCDHCQAPYRSGPSARASTSRSVGTAKPEHAPRAGRPGGARGLIERQSRVVLWGFVAVLTALTAGYLYAGRERAVPAGVVLPNFLAAPMSPIEATNTISAVNSAAQVEERNGELNVRVAAVMFPVKRAGQLALAQQYARADEMIEGRKRAIRFLDAAGSSFAKADPEKGVAMTR